MKQELTPLPTSTIEQYKEVFHDLKYTAVDRDELLDCLTLAFLTRENVLVWGETGEGKTWLTDEVFNRFPDPEYKDHIFKIQFTRDMPPDVLFGGYDIPALQLGTVRYHVLGSILTCRFMFGDEVFDASDFVLRTMLGALSDERTFRFGQQVFEDLPLQTSILTSNFRRDTPATRALLNRIGLQYKISPEPSLAHRAMLDVFNESRRHHQARKLTLPYEDLRELSNIVLGKDKKVSIILPWSVIYLKDKIVNTFVTIAQEKGVALAEETGRASALQKEMLGVDLTALEEEKEAISQELGFPLRFFSDRVAALALNSAQRMAKTSKRIAQPAEEFRVSSSRGMQLSHLLYTSALLNNRQIVIPQDLAMVRFGLYPQAEQPTVLDTVFGQSVHQVFTQTPEEETVQAEEILACVNLTDVLTGKAVKAVIPARLASRVTGFVKQEVGLDDVQKRLSEITPASQTTLEIKAAGLAKIEKAGKITFGQPRVNLAEDRRVFIYSDQKK